MGKRTEKEKAPNRKKSCEGRKAVIGHACVWRSLQRKTGGGGVKKIAQGPGRKKKREQSKLLPIIKNSTIAQFEKKKESSKQKTKDKGEKKGGQSEVLVRGVKKFCKRCV